MPWIIVFFIVAAVLALANHFSPFFLERNNKKTKENNKNIIKNLKLEIQGEVYDPTNRMSSIGRMYFTPEMLTYLEDNDIDPIILLNTKHSEIQPSSGCNYLLKEHGQINGISVCPGCTLLFTPGSQDGVFAVIDKSDKFHLV